MCDDLDPRLARLRDVEPPLPFAAPEAVRRRGEQRARRQASVAAVAVVAVTGVAVGVGSAVLQPSPTIPPGALPSATTSPSPGPSSTAPPGTVPPDWLLTVDDLGPGSWHGLILWRPWREGPEWDSPYPPGWPPPECVETTRPPERIGLGYTAWATNTEGEDAGLYVYQVVERYRPGEAAAYFAMFREGAEHCAGGDVIPGVEYAVVDDGFTGDESLLVRETATSADGTETVEDYVSVVRLGDAVVTLQSNYSEPEGADGAFLRRLAETASARITGSD